MQTDNGYEVYSIQALYDASTDGNLTIDVNGKTVTFLVDAPPLFAVAQDENSNALQTQRALWFVWYANHPNAVIHNHTIH